MKKFLLLAVLCLVPSIASAQTQAQLKYRHDAQTDQEASNYAKTTADCNKEGAEFQYLQALSIRSTADPNNPEYALGDQDMTGGDVRFGFGNDAYSPGVNAWTDANVHMNAGDDLWSQGNYSAASYQYNAASADYKLAKDWFDDAADQYNQAYSLYGQAEGHYWAAQ